jgi:hypothetical protein
MGEIMALGATFGNSFAKVDRAYGRGALSTLAGLISLGGPAAKDARKAYDKLNAALGPENMNPALLSTVPTLNIIPRNMYRVPENAPSCRTS